jgi:hypothetical protein
MRRLVCATVLLTLLAVEARAADENHLGYDMPSQTPARAGCPSVISCLAIPSKTTAYSGYYVGGGKVFGGNGCGPVDGTWGWDYTGRGILYNPRVILGFGTWRKQGGYGSYSPDKGPHVPNPLGWKIPNRGGGEGGEE